MTRIAKACWTVVIGMVICLLAPVPVIVGHSAGVGLYLLLRTATIAIFVLGFGTIVSGVVQVARAAAQTLR